MADLKTQPTPESVTDFLSTLDASQREDSETLIGILSRITGDEPVMWGPNIIGFGKRHLKYESGRELDWMKIGFAPRKGKLVLYCPGYLENYAEDLALIGKHKIGKGCLYINKLADVDVAKLELVLTKIEKDAAR